LEELRSRLEVFDDRTAPRGTIAFGARADSHRSSCPLPFSTLSALWRRSGCGFLAEFRLDQQTKWGQLASGPNLGGRRIGLKLLAMTEKMIRCVQLIYGMIRVF
jgi:hypothetical protein